MRAISRALTLLLWMGALGRALADPSPLDASAALEPPSASPSPPPSPPPAPPSGILDLPFIPIPLIATDPNSGTTVGLLPTWLETNEQHQIDRIIAPDFQYNPNFGWGAHARILDFPSGEVQWSAVAGVNQRVQRYVDLEYQSGRLRDVPWSFSASLVYDRDGTPRFYGLGNGTPRSAGTNYTSNQLLAEAQIGYNFTRALQLQYTLRFQDVEVLPGTLPGIPSIEKQFSGELGTTHELLNRLSVAYDTRDDVTVPSRGMSWVVYTGFASHSAFGEPAYSEAGVDGSLYWPVSGSTVVAMHVAVRYLPTAQDAKFWELSTLGGGDSVVGAEQPLRGFGAGRFTDRNSLSFTTEVRRRVARIAILRTRVDLEVTPFVDLGKVFQGLGTSPISELHKVFGVGFRGVARPFIVGRVDVGYGSEGAAVFTGIAYPF